MKNSQTKTANMERNTHHRGWYIHLPHKQEHLPELAHAAGRVL